MTILLTAQAEQSRFLRIVRDYSYPEYLVEKKEFSLLLGYAQPLENTFVLYDTMHIITKDTVSSVRQFFKGDVLYDFQKIENLLHTCFSKNIRIGFNNTYDLYGLSAVSSVTTRDYLDTSEYRGGLIGTYALGYKKYFLDKWSVPFIECSGSILAELVLQTRKDFMPLIDAQLSNFEKMDRHHFNGQSLNTVVDVVLGLGSGRQQNIAPVYQAFRVENRLLKNGVSDFILSDTTMTGVARYLAKNNSYTLRKPEKAQEFKKGFDSTLLHDAAVEQKNLRHLSSMEIKKIVLSDVPVLLTRPIARIFSVSRLMTDIVRYDLTYPYDVLDWYDDTTYVRPGIHYKQILGIDADWGYPVLRRVFVSMHAARILLSTENRIHFINHEQKSVYWDEVLDVRWNPELSWWISEWITLQIGADNWPAWICIPRTWPMLVDVKLNVLFEDNLAFSFGSVYFNKTFDDDPYWNWNDPLKKQRRQPSFLFFFKVMYSF